VITTFDECDKNSVVTNLIIHLHHGFFAGGKSYLSKEGTRLIAYEFWVQRLVSHELSGGLQKIRRFEDKAIGLEERV